MSPHTKQDEAVESTRKIREIPFSKAESAEGNEEATPGKQDGLRNARMADEVATDLKEGREVTLNENPDEQENLPKDKIAITMSQPASSQKEEMPITSQDPMESSTATLRPMAPSEKQESEESTPYDYSYLDPTPKTPAPSLPPSRSTSHAKSVPRHGRESERSPSRSDVGFDETHSTSDDDRETGSRSEIQTIMDQFDEKGGGPGAEEVMSPRLQYASSLLSSPIHPPRKSSLEHLNTTQNRAIQSVDDSNDFNGKRSAVEAGNCIDIGPAVPPKPSSMYSGTTATSFVHDDHSTATETPLSPMSTLHRPPPPEEPDRPFNFHEFLEQLRHRSADPVAKYTKSFLNEFSKKQWMVHEQVKIIGDFLVFIIGKMSQCEVWREASDTEFDNAREGIEKLIMNRLYTQTFSPAIAPPQPLPGSRGRGKNAERYMGPGRKGQHQEDVERDEILATKIRIYGWVREEHLDIPPVGDNGKRFLVLAQQELLKINNYRAPRDKIICVLNCCKAIFGLLKHSKSDSSADSFIPLLIYVVLQANPDHLVSNVSYILRFRNQDKLTGEAGYYISSLSGAISFIENLGRTTLTISDKEFEDNVEAAVSAIAEKHQADETSSIPPVQLSEKSAPSRPEVVRTSFEAESSSMPRNSTSSYDSASDGQEEKAISGLLRTIQRPLSTIGRIFSDSDHSTPTGNASRGVSPLPSKDRQSMEAPSGARRPVTARGNAEEAAARQASAETFQAQKLQRAEHNNVVETLASMFPEMDKDIISDVVRQKEGRVGLAVDACLALSS